jgi:beta-glucosidase
MTGALAAVVLYHAFCGAQGVSPEQRADVLIRKMTIAEKIQQLHGVANAEHERWVPGIDRLQIPPLPMANGPAGIGPADLIQPRATAFPAPIAVAASWSRKDASNYGVAVASEIQSIGRTMLEAPTVNICRIPTSGRTFEGYGEDPFLSSEMSVENIQGIQSLHVLANVKHFALNNQEQGRLSVNAIADERAMREIYFPPFEFAVKKGHVASLMCSYNKVNGEYACQNKHLLTDVLRNDWHFDGFIVSDFGAAHDGIKDALAGMDLEMMKGDTYNNDFEAQVGHGTISIPQIDDLLRYRYATMIRFGLFDSSIASRPLAKKRDGKIAQHLATDGIVLLKNERSVLPIDVKRVKSIAVVGPATDRLLEGGGAASVLPLHTISPIQALRIRFGSDHLRYVPVGGPGFIDPNDTLDSFAISPQNSSMKEHGVRAEYFDNTEFFGTPKIVRTERIPEIISEFGSPVSGVSDKFSLRWTANLVAPASGTYTLGIEMWGKMRLYLDGKLLIEQTQRLNSIESALTQIHLEKGHVYVLRADYNSTGRGIARIFWQLPENVEMPGIAKAVEAARHADIAVVFAGVWSHEGFDRATMGLPGLQDRLIEAIAAVNPRTIVVVQSGGPILMPWLHQVAAVVEAWFPGEEGGAAIASVLAGDVNPSGKLPITFPASNDQVPAATPDQYPGIDGIEHYSEGLYVGYRWQDAMNKVPLFPFGYGLSYTQFQMSQMSYTPLSTGSVKVGVTVTNKGQRAGAEVVQLYVGYPKEVQEPPLQLRAFSKTYLQPGGSARLSFILDRRAFSYWSVAEHQWKIAPGSYTIAIGDSSRNLPLHKSIQR